MYTLLFALACSAAPQEAETRRETRTPEAAAPEVGEAVIGSLDTKGERVPLCHRRTEQGHASADGEAPGRECKAPQDLIDETRGPGALGYSD